ncbi:MAG: hypothetical protein K2Y40_05325 [Reyranella sp.]|nr:hypothetical protein [Reyranella sp.]
MARAKREAADGMVEVEILANFMAGPRGATPYAKGQQPHPVVSVDDADNWEAKGLTRRAHTSAPLED